MLKFTREKTLSPGLGRAGTIETPHGVLRTPAFIPVGTKATVKSLTPELVRDAVGAQAVLANTYHLYLQPGEEVLAKAGGLGKFMNWSGPTFTDSGGFQAFSLGAALGKGISKLKSSSDDEHDGRSADQSVNVLRARIDEDGVDFKSVIDGSPHRFTPERSIEIQHAIGADVIFAFDECAAPNASYEYQKEAMERTHRWARRCLVRHAELNAARAGRGEPTLALYGIVQGGRHEDLRRESARAIGSMKISTAEGEISFDGFGIGGSFDKEDIGTAVRWVCEELPPEKPRHLLGIGEPEDLVLGIENGIDTFDCVAPTRLARHGSAYIRKSALFPKGRINLSAAAYVADLAPLDPECGCSTCAHYSRAYIAHLFRAQEMLAATLVSVHNVYYLVNLVETLRAAILKGNFEEEKQRA